MKHKKKPALEKLQQELDYSFDFKARNLHPGKWPAMGGSAGGFSFEKFDQLSNHPDFRRIDFLATVRNPLIKEPLVRKFKPMARIDVIMLADLSPSLLCGFNEPKIFQLAKLSTLFGYTAFRFGDRFGLLGFDDRVLSDFIYPPVRSRTVGLEIGEEILNYDPPAPTKGRLNLDLQSVLPKKKSLIILVSDFYFNPEDLRSILGDLQRHAVLPVMLRQKWEQQWPRSLFGFLRLRDPETGGERVLFFSPRTVRKFNRRAEESRIEMEKIFRSFSLAPLTLDRVTMDHFLDAMERREG